MLVLTKIESYILAITQYNWCLTINLSYISIYFESKYAWITFIYRWCEL